MNKLSFKEKRKFKRRAKILSIIGYPLLAITIFAIVQKMLN